jgi:hypothetical protein
MASEYRRIEVTPGHAIRARRMPRTVAPAGKVVVQRHHTRDTDPITIDAAVWDRSPEWSAA